MTQTPAPQTPKTGSSSKKLIIILAVVFGGILFICCGGFVTCSLIARSAASRAQSQLSELQKDFEIAAKKAEAEAAKQQAAAEQAQKDAEKANAENTGPVKSTATPPSETNGNGLDKLPEVRLPTVFPKDVPLYAGAKVVGSSAQNKTSFVTATTPAAADKVYDFYTAKLTSDGWTSDSNAEFNGVRAGTYIKGDRKLTVTVSPGADGTMLTISHEAK